MPAMEKSFAPAEVEPRWRARWLELGVGHADADSEREPFVIVLPPPNITAELHLGHAASSAVQDTLCRHWRMRGREVEWCPGTDHAAIATQAVIERQLAVEGTTKETIGRAAFDERVDAWYSATGDRIFEQMRGLGFLCDWERARFTLDEPYVRAIRVVFKRLFDEGLIYRGPRIVNWCPRNLSAISDEEVRWEEHQDTLVHISYPVEGGGSIVVATVRPETMLGDTGVAVSPGDPRYSALVGRQVRLPLSGRLVPIVEDAAVRPDFGTGALKVTPGHDPTDYEIGERHSLEVLSVIADDGTMDVPSLLRFHGLEVVSARREVTAALREAGAIVAEEPYTHDVGHCDRCGAVIEPLVSAQWWVRMTELAAPAVRAVEVGRVRFHPARPHTDVFTTWMRDIRDWCISRQLWLGHRIPVSTCADGHVFAWVDPPARCPSCGSTELRDDPDVLDTWFSSGLWPFAIFGWPEPTSDLRAFYPGHVLVTAREIIFLWVARMIMLGLRFCDDVPFSDVIINSTILAADGGRMSKSRGNGVDPLAMIERHGADAVRAWSAAVGTATQDMRFDEKRMEAYRFFANKLWNVTRLLVARLGGAEAERIPDVGGAPDPDSLRSEDRWLLRRLALTAEAVDAGIAQFRFHDAIERLYATAWEQYCSTWIELAKDRLGEDPAAAWTAVTALDVLLRLLHPFMPFVTEECAQRLPDPAVTLQRRSWPELPREWATEDMRITSVDAVLELAVALRARRQEAAVPAQQVLDVVIADAGAGLPPDEVRRLLEALRDLRVRAVEAVPDGTRPLRVVAGGMEAALCVARPDPPAERARLHDELRRARSEAARVRARLGPEFLERAPAAVVAGARQQLGEAEARVASLERILASLTEAPDGVVAASEDRR